MTILLTHFLVHVLAFLKSEVSWLEALNLLIMVNVKAVKILGRLEGLSLAQDDFFAPGLEGLLRLRLEEECGLVGLLLDLAPSLLSVLLELPFLDLYKLPEASGNVDGLEMGGGVETVDVFLLVVDGPGVEGRIGHSLPLFIDEQLLGFGIPWKRVLVLLVVSLQEQQNLLPKLASSPSSW